MLDFIFSKVTYYQPVVMSLTSFHNDPFQDKEIESRPFQRFSGTTIETKVCDMTSEIDLNILSPFKFFDITYSILRISSNASIVGDSSPNHKWMHLRPS